MDFLKCFCISLLLWISARLLLFFQRQKTSCSLKHLPPGPYFFTNLWNLTSLSRQPHKYFADLAKSYGPLMSIQLGSVTNVVVSSESVAREVLQKNDASFCYRSQMISFAVLHHDEATVAFMPPNAAWKNLRKIFKSHMFNTGKVESTKGLRREKVQQLLAYTHRRCEGGALVNIGEVASTASLNVLSNVIFSVDVVDPIRDPLHQGELWELVLNIGKIIGKPNVADYIPMVGVIDPQGITSQTASLVGKATRILDELIMQRIQSRKETDHGKDADLLDIFLTACEEEGNELKLAHIPHVILELFVGGTDTTSSTIEWAMAELLRNPEKLKKAQAELEQVIGKGNQVEEDDIDRLPYLNAVVKETFRLHPSIPFLVPRTVITDVDLCGFTVPKDAKVLVNIWAIGRDESLWEDANAFVPERFITRPDIDVKGHDFELLPFGAGRRMCPGMPVAHRMTHCVLGSLIHFFDWKLQDGLTYRSIDMDDTFGFSLRKAQALKAFPCMKA